ncbi:sortase domain-bontaining protein [uncultured Ilumatobacter sp.]|uniref:sortase domain-containing protein n=1 Tax=Ilumatobacter sp. TaxID=1967498 RepID=UPI00374E6F4C
MRLNTLHNGPGRWPGTAMPGQNGSVVVAGHRTSHGAVFQTDDPERFVSCVPTVLSCRRVEP